MRDSQYGGPIGRSTDDLSLLARTVVARLAARGGRVQRPVDADMVQAIARAVVSDGFEALRPDIRRARIADTDLVDSYFPAVARQLGCDWAEDRAPWADVTIGLARMQSLVHQIGLDWDGTTATEAESVLLVLPEGEQHSFGVQVLAGQMRRQGISVHLQIGPRLAALRGLLQERQYDCALISVGCEERLDASGKLVNILKESSKGRLWVAVGGAVLDREADVLSRTGADIATNDLALALGGAVLANPAALCNMPEIGSGIGPKASKAQAAGSRLAAS